MRRQRKAKTKLQFHYLSLACIEVCGAAAPTAALVEHLASWALLFLLFTAAVSFFCLLFKTDKSRLEKVQFTDW